MNFKLLRCRPRWRDKNSGKTGLDRRIVLRGKHTLDRYSIARKFRLSHNLKLSDERDRFPQRLDDRGQRGRQKEGRQANASRTETRYERSACAPQKATTTIVMSRPAPKSVLVQPARAMHGDQQRKTSGQPTAACAPRCLHLYTTLVACVSAGAEGQPAPESWPSVAAIYWHGIANFRQRLPLWRRSCTHPHFSSGFPLSPLLFFSHHSPSV